MKELELFFTKSLIFYIFIPTPRITPIGSFQKLECCASMWFFKFLLLFKPSPKLVQHYCLIYGMTDEKGRFVQPVNIVQIRAGWGAAERYDGDRER